MSELNNFSNAIYNQFFLRDVLGKITPGALLCIGVLSSPALRHEDSIKTFLNSTTTSNFTATIISVGLLWILGVIIQTFGESLKLTHAYPNQSNEDSARFFRQRRDLFIKEYPTGILQNQRERYVIIKEATANTLSSIVIISVFYLILFFMYYAKWGNISLGIVDFLIFPVLLLIIILTRKAFNEYKIRQAVYEIEILERNSHITSITAEKMKINAGIPQ